MIGFDFLVVFCLIYVFNFSRFSLVTEESTRLLTENSNTPSKHVSYDLKLSNITADLVYDSSYTVVLTLV